MAAVIQVERDAGDGDDRLLGDCPILVSGEVVQAGERLARIGARDDGAAQLDTDQRQRGLESVVFRPLQDALTEGAASNAVTPYGESRGQQAGDSRVGTAGGGSRPVLGELERGFRAVHPQRLLCEGHAEIAAVADR
ncbi:hypothetical protein [Frankia canadensis]|uniref:hypothetical protein n=1 Tax=Frankia canadensis TaxID=1836972 RepID=UPI00105580D4|nr:hypothetical protein [Frankia canadensis]